MQLNIYSVIIFFCAVLMAAIAGYAWRHRATPGAQMFAIFLFAQIIYTLGYSLELASLSLPLMLIWSRVEYLGIYTFPTLFLLFVIQYTGSASWLTRRKFVLFCLVPVILLFAKFTDPWFHLIYATTWVDTQAPIPVLAFTRGPVYYLGGTYTLLMIASGVFLLWYKRRYSSPLYRSQATVISLVALAGLIFYFIYLSGVVVVPSLAHLDPFAFSYAVWGSILGWALFRFRLFDLTPVARAALVENLPDAVIVLDSQCRIVDTNPAALMLFGWNSSPIGQPARQALSDWIQLPTGCPADDQIRSQVSREENGETHHYDVRISALRERRGQVGGHLMIIHDITEQKRNEEMLRDLSLVDDLTGLNNRRGFYLLARQLLLTLERMDLGAVVIFADLDSLKRINDTLGHTTGDQAIMDAAQIMRDSFRSSDIIARLSGDEFIGMAVETTEKSGDAILARLQQKTITFNLQSNRPYKLSISFGMARCEPGSPAVLETLIHNADQAMYTQKRARSQA
jgi:diguanylate cyclase (GGDEF)-like protein/PAS domain S-box-containing protein